MATSMSMLELGTGDENLQNSMESLSSEQLLSLDKISRPCLCTQSSLPPSTLTLLKHRILFISAWFWRKFGQRLFRLFSVILLIYIIVFVLWFNDVIQKCRIPYHEEFSYNSYFGGTLRLIAKNFTQQLTLLPGLVCVPQVKIDYATATWNDFMEAVALFKALF